MQLDLKQVFQQEGLKLPISLSLDFSGEELYGACPFTAPVAISGSVENQNSIVVLRYTAEVGYERECDRCLTVSKTVYSLEFEHLLSSTLEYSESDDLIFIPDFRLDIFEVAREDIILAMPTRYLCVQECKGLCPKCGCNLNRGQCQCDLSEPDPRLAALRQLLEEE